ncbi:secretion/DNA translocation related TadE-like protein [Propionicimonas paludicola]|uniref:Secretion/DNA translocation related TadE-like protein n=1 Tax=Propionicimonas paludicola TaxID=185243 RepID=A0A2A9CTK3_9ACTN|nr:secretion/DNA translocation related TadE-like protein [Propionicimonas paludicola]
MLVATVVCLSLLLGVGVALVVGYSAAAQKANAAADLVALSGASAQATGEGACRGAARAAQANAVRLSGCRVVGDLLEFAVAVEVEVSVPHALPGLPDHLVARATAGRTAPDPPG